MALDDALAREGADWIAEMVSEQLGGFVPAEFCDLVMESEERVRRDSGDPGMPHLAMAQQLMARFAADPQIPTQRGAISTMLIAEVLSWEDEFLALAGRPRSVRRS